jgi:hypothetical protein
MMLMRFCNKAGYIVFALSALFYSNFAFANGVPVIFGVVIMHIIIINTLVVAIEAILLKSFSKTKIYWGFVLLANLSSLFLAYALTSKLVITYFGNNWFGMEGKGVIPKWTFIRGVIFFIVLTILIEWPFYHLAQKENKTWMRSLKYSAIINLATNIPIAIFYLLNNLYYDTGD